MGKYAPRNNEGRHRIAKDDPRAISLLKEEHHVFRKLFDSFEASRDAARERRKEIADELCLRLSVHMAIEEEILYPALKDVVDADEVDEGIVEHQSGKRIIAELEQLQGDEELFNSKVHVLGEETVHHIDEEDEELFADAAKAHADGRIDLDTLGDELRKRQRELYDDIARTGETGPTHEAMADEVPAVDNNR